MRLGEFEKFKGAGLGDLDSRGAILHLYRATGASGQTAAAAKPPAGEAGGARGAPSKVRVSYFTAPAAAPGAASGGDARLLPPAPAGGPPAHAPGGGTAMDVGLPLIWDQEKLGATASSKFEFSLDSPPLKVGARRAWGGALGHGDDGHGEPMVPGEERCTRAR